ncbi:MAG: hypothetical protein WCP77_16730 [Roseococcus sp.]|jgi:hypothetical protein
MSIHVECGEVRTVGTGIQPIEVAGSLAWSETVATAGNTTNAAPASTNPAISAMVLTVTAEVDVWLALGATPNPGGSPRRRLKAGQTRSFLAPVGTKVGWAAT